MKPHEQVTLALSLLEIETGFLYANRTEPDRYYAFCPRLDLRVIDSTEEGAVELLMVEMEILLNECPSLVTDILYPPAGKNG